MIWILMMITHLILEKTNRSCKHYLWFFNMCFNCTVREKEGGGEFILRMFVWNDEIHICSIDLVFFL
jgi:hypothetical protein